MRIGIVSLLMAMAAVGPAAAQPAVAPPRDPIADILNRSVPPPKDEDEPDTAGQPRAGPDTAPEANPVPRTGPQPSPQPPFAPSPRQQRNAPVRIEETGKTPDAPPNVRDLAYDARLRSSFASAENFQGPLEGGWTLAEARDGDRYALQIVDRRDRLEAVWRDLRRTGSLYASGLVDDIQRAGSDLTLRFGAAGDTASVVRLHQAADGRWTGELARGDQRVTVTLRKTSP